MWFVVRGYEIPDIKCSGEGGRRSGAKKTVKALWAKCISMEELFTLLFDVRHGLMKARSKRAANSLVLFRLLLFGMWIHPSLNKLVSVFLFLSRLSAVSPLNLEPSRKGQWLIPYLYRHKRQHSTDMMMGTTTHNQQEQYEVLFLNQIMLWNLPIS